MEFVMEKIVNLVENFKFDPRCHLVDYLILNGITDANVLINTTEKLLDFIGEIKVFDNPAPEEKSLSIWRKDMVVKLMRQGLSDANQIINTINKLYDFLRTSN